MINVCRKARTAFLCVFRGLKCALINPIVCTRCEKVARQLINLEVWSSGNLRRLMDFETKNSRYSVVNMATCFTDGESRVWLSICTAQLFSSMGFSGSPGKMPYKPDYLLHGRDEHGSIPSRNGRFFRIRNRNRQIRNGLPDLAKVKGSSCQNLESWFFCEINECDFRIGIGVEAFFFI